MDSARMEITSGKIWLNLVKHILMHSFYLHMAIIFTPRSTLLKWRPSRFYQAMPATTNTTPPILYTFRRCPYAIRARLAIAGSGVFVTEHEVDLRNKPHAMLDISPKATVPVLHLTDGTVIEESLDIMRWALQQNDPEHWLSHHDAGINSLIVQNDSQFKRDLDHYKYPNRFPESAMENYREACEKFVRILDNRLASSPFLNGDKFTFADAAIVPFIRQFAHVDKDWFYQSPYQHVINWLDQILATEIFIDVMKKPKI
jgi:glutathione S-transferase